MATLNVTNRTGLLSALNSAQGGDTIVLAKANYGWLDITQDYASTVTIKSASPLAAQFDGASILGASNVRVDGVHVSGAGNGGIGSKIVEIDEGSHHIQFANSEVNGLVDTNFSGHYGIYLGGTTHNITLSNNNIHDAFRGIVSYGADYLDVSENDFGRLGEDTMTFSSVNTGKFVNNFSSGPAITGSHLDFISFYGNNNNLEIEGNVLLPSKIPNVQGIFFDPAAYNTNVTIENNVIWTGMINGIFLQTGSGVTVKNNTLLNLKGEVHTGTAVRVVAGSTVQNNIDVSWVGDQGQDSSKNITLQNLDPNKSFYTNTFYVGGNKGLGATLSDLAMVKGSLAESVGAFARITELLGGSAPAPAPAPAPTPTPTLLYSKLGATEIADASNVINIAPASKYAVSEATVAFSFDADTVSGMHGLFAKDAYMYEGGGNHFAAYLKNGVLNVMFEGASSRKIFAVGGIQANHKYDLQASFGGGKVSVWLDDKLVGSASFLTDWTYNREYMQIGAHGGWSKTGAADFLYVFDGTISDVRIAKGAQSLAAMDTLLGSALHVAAVETDESATTVAMASHAFDPASILTEDALQKAMDAATQHWSDQGATAKELQALSKTHVQIGDLGGTMLGLTAGQVITLDDDAAGYGWHADVGSSVAEGKVDLISALVHEYGHILGYDHDAMGETLGVGDRHLALDDVPSSGEATTPSDLI